MRRLGFWLALLKAWWYRPLTPCRIIYYRHEPPTQALRHPAVPGADNGHTVRAPYQGAQPRAGRP